VTGCGPVPEAVARGNYVLLRPIQRYAVGVYDLAARKIILANKTRAFDIHGNVFASERTNGEVGLYRVGGSSHPGGGTPTVYCHGNPSHGGDWVPFLEGGGPAVAIDMMNLARDASELGSIAKARRGAGIPGRPGRLLADCGYWSIANLTETPDAPALLIPPARHGRQGKPRKDGKPSASRSDGLRAAMTARLASADGKARYALRQQTIEPVFGQIKDVRGARRFMRRGLAACDAEWKLLCGTHNLLKLWRHTRSRPAPTPLAT